ncbi:MAG: hypothetical protein R3E02_10755 [Blastomonas sp.]
MKFTRIIAALAAPLLLTGCLLSPGKFDSSLDVDANGSFTFRYAGELVILDTSQADAQPAEFEPYGCYDEDTFEDRDCTEAEIAEQRAEFEANQATMNSNGPPAGMGFLDDDASIEEFVEQLRKQKGWESVEYRGNKIIDVVYETTGTLSHGFSFPAIDGGKGIMPFVTLTLRKDGGVKMSAPAFSNGGSEMMGSLAAMGAASGKAGSGEQAPQPEGTFTVRTNGTILTNNTENGPETENGWSVLSWNVSPRTNNPPEALILLSQ